MGWTSYYVGYGCNRKDECMKYVNGFKNEKGETTARLIKSVMKGTTFYALMETVEKKQQFIICLLTSISKGEFYYKDIQCNPYEVGVPMSLVKAFIPTTDEDKAWKEKCLAESVQLVSDNTFKIGDVIECKNGRCEISWGSSKIKPHETFYVRIDGHKTRSKTTKHYVVVKKENIIEVVRNFGSTKTDAEILAINSGKEYRYRSTLCRLTAKAFNNLAEVKLIDRV